MNVHLTKIEDHEGGGTCGHCGREGLRWIAVLSDGSRWGTACAKKVLGVVSPSPRNLEWASKYVPVAEHVEGDVTFVMWQQKRGWQTIQTRNGYMTTVGGVRREWERKGWV